MAAASMHVRPARYTDHAAVAGIFVDFARLHHGWRPSFFRPTLIGFTQAVFQTWLEEPDELNLVAEVGGGVVGYPRASRFAGSFSNEFVFPRRGVHVGVLAVAEEARRQGVGRALFRAVEEWAKEFEAESIGLDVSPLNATARAFYTSLGYAPVNEYRAKPLRHVRRFEADS
jgi:ribosomal protein S18 acetylase RimI-like enzyme